jgi:hypothetical protein
VITLETVTTSVDTDPFVRAVAARVPVVWYHRFRRRLQIVTAQPFPRRDLPVELVGERVFVVTSEASIVSLVRESGLEGTEMESFFRTVGGRAPLALQGGIDRHSISAALPHEQATEVLHQLHASFVGGRVLQG